jgi:pimeloyl-ACP methyl ester carboxylesterase
MNPSRAGNPARTRAFLAALALTSLSAFGACGPPAPLTRVRTTDGYTIAVDLQAPPDPEKAPLVVLCHQQFQDRTSWDPVVPRLLEKGWSVLRLDHRGSGESRDEVASPMELPSDRSDSFHEDILAAINGAQGRPGVDASRVAIIASGFSVAYAARCARLDPRVKALVLISGYLPPAEEDFLIAHPEFPVFLTVSSQDEQGTNVARQHANRLRGEMQELIEVGPVESDSSKWVGTEGLRDETGLADLILWKLEAMFPPGA